MSKKRHDRNKVLSYNAFLNLINLDRGIGKSYAYYSFVIDRFINYGEKFIYLRRNKTELIEGKNSFFNDFYSNPKYKNHKFSVNKNLMIDNQLAGYCVRLSRADSVKSAARPDVKYIVFDEFVPENKGIKYLPNEPELLSSLIVSTFRDRDGKVFLLGNKTSNITPYNIYFNLPTFDDNYFDKDRRILIYCNDANASAEEIYKNTPVFNLLKGTKYFDYAYKNISLNDNNMFIKLKPVGSTLVCNFVKDNTCIGLFYSNKRLYLDEKTDSTFPIKFSIDKNKILENSILFTKANYQHDTIRAAFRHGRIFYSNEKVYEIMQPFICKVGY